MPIFNYRARDETGRSIQGKMESESVSALADKLRSLRYTVVSVTPTRPFFSWKFELPSFFTPIRTEDYVIYTTQLSSMLSAGMPLSSCLDILAEQTENRTLKMATAYVSQDVRAGASLTEALGKHPKVFPELFTNMLAAGEVAGNLEEVLTRLSAFLEKQAAFKQAVMTALFYPIILSLFSVVVVIIIILTVLPTFVKMFSESGVPLPLPTQVLYSTNLLIRGYWQIILVVIVILAVLFNYLSNTRIGKAFLDRLALDLPFWGPLTRKVNIARFCSTLASLLSAGVPLLQALETLEETSDNQVFKEVAAKVRTEVSRGGSLADQLKASGEFPPMPVKMVAVGEESGKLPQMLGKIADFYEMAVDFTVKRLTSILEPFFLIVVGGIVAFIFASVLLPIFNMIKVIKH